MRLELARCKPPTNTRTLIRLRAIQTRELVVPLNLAALNEAIADAYPERNAIISSGGSTTYAALTERSRRLANCLSDHGLGCDTERSALQPWESGQSHVGLYLYNCPEYLEGMLGSFKSRSVPFNVNYRYVDEELLYLLNNAKTRALIFHSSLANHVATVRSQIPTLELLLQVQDPDDPQPLIEGAVDYEAALGAASSERPDLAWSPDDLYMLYTGGTTGMPKGVLWRQGDALVGALGGRRSNGAVLASIDEFVERASGNTLRHLPSAPFMHGAGHWVAFQAFHTGGAVVLQENVKRLDAMDILDTVEKHGVTNLLMVGDAFGRPIADALAATGRKLPSLRGIVTGGAITTAKVKAELIAALPQVTIVDSAGSSETGSQGQQISNAKAGAATGRFKLTPGNAVLKEDLSGVLEPGHEGLGWWARTGHIPLGYLSDATKTEATFPTIDGTRYSVPGDRVRLLADGALELFGRESVTINSGGEKIFAEEVEQALKHHADVFDAVVAGRSSERWGQEVVAIVRMREGVAANENSILEECERHIARYKLPKAFIYVAEIQRSPSGKADYRWANETAKTSS